MSDQPAPDALREALERQVTGEGAMATDPDGECYFCEAEGVDYEAPFHPDADPEDVGTHEDWCLVPIARAALAATPPASVPIGDNGEEWHAHGGLGMHSHPKPATPPASAVAYTNVTGEDYVMAEPTPPASAERAAVVEAAEQWVVSRTTPDGYRDVMTEQDATLTLAVDALRAAEARDES
jgi:hypothetical protein